MTGFAPKISAHPSPCLSNEASAASANLLVPLEESFLQFEYLLIGTLLSKP